MSARKGKLSNSPQLWCHVLEHRQERVSMVGRVSILAEQVRVLYDRIAHRSLSATLQIDARLVSVHVLLGHWRPLGGDGHS